MVRFLVASSRTDIDISDGKGRLFCKGRILYALRQRGTTE